MTGCGARGRLLFEGLLPPDLNDCPAPDRNSADIRDIDAIMETVGVHQTGMVWRIRRAANNSQTPTPLQPR
jgi:hypothetical protein